jgi:beta-lactamase regulating signal transducer with metallopeptidase domain
MHQISAFISGEVPAQVSAWLATYLVHGVCLFAIAALATRLVKSARGAEQLWRAALFGPIVTASLQLGAGLSPALGHWELPGSDSLTVEVVAPAAIAAVPAALDAQNLEAQEAAVVAELGRLTDRLVILTEGGRAPAQSPASTPKVVSAQFERFTPSRWGSTVGLIAVAAGIAMLMLRALLEAIRMHSLGRRSALMSGPVVDLVRNLGERAGVRRRIRVEVSEEGSSPYATGVLMPRVVLPRRALTELDGPSLQAMLAHEIGHVARFDPLWTAAARSVAALFFFQPLNWLLVARLDESAEYCCDEFAVDVTGNEVALARCLTTVAEWIIGAPAARPACPMAHKRSPLGSRVNRILATDGQPTKPLGTLRWVGGAAVLATAMAAPGFAAKQASAFEVEAAPAPAIIEVVGAPTMTPFDALNVSIDQLQEEIRTLIVLAAKREVPRATVGRLEKLYVRANRVRAYVDQLESRMRQLTR